MKRGLWIFVVMVSVFIFAAGHVFAQANKEIEEMKGQIEVLTEEVEKLKLGAVAEPKYESFSGLGPAASKVYGVDRGLSIGGYGEVVYSNYQDSSKKDFADAYRFILYAGYKFNDWIIMNTELEFEHAGFDTIDDKKSETYVEFSNLDFLIHKSFNVRTGLILIPVGVINEFHEPTVYHGVLRPEVESNIIPTTWRDIGVMAYGEAGPVSYNLAIVNGLRADKFNDSTWIRSGKQQGSKVNADAWGSVTRVDYEPLAGLVIGGSYYFGEAKDGKGGNENKATDKEGDVRLWEVHAQYQHRGLHLRGLYAKGSLDGNSELEATSGLGKEVEGWYVETAFDIMPHIMPASEMSLSPFLRHEEYDTNKEVFTGTRNLIYDRNVITAGLGFKPHPNVIIKADYQSKDTASGLSSGKGIGKDENKIDQFNLGIGFIF